MPRYYFDFQNGGARPDADGADFPVADDARREARHTLIEVAGDRFLRAGAGDQTVSLSVRDETGAIVFEGSVSIRTSRPAGSSGPKP